MRYLVTVKIPKNPRHDPANKKTGVCPFSSLCTDVTGAHHTMWFESNLSIDEVKHKYELSYHVTRIEVAE